LLTAGCSQGVCTGGGGLLECSGSEFIPPSKVD